MKYYRKIETSFTRALSIAKRRRKTYALTTIITAITLMAFFVNSPVVLEHESELRYFKVSSNDNIFRTGETVTFNWSLMGTPQKLILIFGDGNIQEVAGECFKDNGALYGSVKHQYSFQGKYTPILKAYYPGKTLKKILDVFIRNDAPLFSFGFNGELHNTGGSLHTSTSSFQTFEDEEVDITVNVTNNLTNDTLTYQFNFGDSQVVTENNYITHTWENTGSYPVTVTVVGAQGELSKQTQYIDVLNRRPNASFRITNGHDIAVGKEIEFTAEDSYDTLSDKNNLRYIWNWGDSLMDYGKVVSHTYYESGSYTVTLIVKDDDSFVDQTSRTIVIENFNPDITIVRDSYNSSLIINEGEEALFSTSSQDDDPAIFKLLYYWNFGSVEFDPLSLESYQLGGWKNKHVFDDDFKGNVTVGVIDAYNEFNSDSINVQILNVAPQIGVLGAGIVSNVSFQVYRNDKAMEANFTFVVFKDNESSVNRLLSFSNSNQTEISTEKALAHFNLANRWKLAVNSSDILPTDSLFQASIKLTFVDGQELILYSEQMLGGSYGEWEVDLSSEFYDEQNYSFKYPITFTTQVVDPSKDEVQYSVSYQESKLLEINCSDILPISINFAVQGTEYVVKVYEQDSKQYANITAQKLVFSELFDNKTFPLREDVQINISPLINIYDILQGRLGLSDLTVETCLIADNKIIIYAVDDDLGEDTLTFGFDSLVGIELTQDFILVPTSISSNVNPVPFGKIGGFSSTAYEGERVKFTSKTNDQDIPGIIFMWDFGDGTATYSEHAKHAWVNAGVYNITLTIADPFGNIHRDQKKITILSKAPEIVGPFAFQGSEGSSIVLDVEIYDSSKDEPRLEYFWYDDKGELISQEPKPVLTLNDGTHTYTLKVVDPSGMSSSKEIVVTMHSLSPKIYMSNYMYHGIEGDFRFNNIGELELKAFALDTLFDSEKLYFYWTIRNGKEILRIQDCRYQVYSIVTFTCKETTNYEGEVRVVDPEGNEAVATFQIISSIDSSLDGIDDETEEMLRLSDDPSDSDGDGLTDTYEMTISNTSYLDPDTDGDLLWDGQTVNGSIGEQAISTDPLDWDCDDDFLSDGTEYFGYNITVVYFENASTFHVTSDPLDTDTDNDGLSDYEEYYAGSNPRQIDTDNDDLTDDIDPFPTKWDGDEDLLSDYEEIMRGTDYNNTDTDQDGLKDGEEVYGWGIGFFTNPLDADSDHDHVSDSAEIKNYLVKLQDEGFDDLDKKVNFASPISLHFPHHFEQAVAAQISFGVSFGEYGQNATDSYGVADEDVQNFKIIIVKAGDGIILANFTTNSTRYFSQVVDITGILNNVSLGLNYFGDYEIGIGIPDNTTGEGSYQGTYSFENDDIGSNPAGWIVYEGTGTVNVISQLDGRIKVVEFEDTGAGQVYMYDIISRDTGTIEYWVRLEDTTDDMWCDLLGSGDDMYFYFRDNGQYGYYEAGYNDIGSYNADQWYHVRIAFDKDTDWHLWIDEVSIDGGSGYGYYGSSGANTFTALKFETANPASGKGYFDAIGYSWDPSYNVGDNLNEETIQYSFDGSGHYPGTYSFENDDIGSNPAGWIVYEGTGTVNVISQLDGRTKVVEFEDTGAGQVYMDDIISRDTGTIEYWGRLDATTDDLWCDLLSSADDMYFYFRANGQYGYYDTGYHDLGSYNADQWYHVRIDFDKDTDWHLWIDGVSIDGGSGYGYYGSSGANTFTTLKFETSNSDTGTSCLDAIGYSWDPNYEIGDNRYDPTDTGCYLDYFELEFCSYLDPNDPDCDNDGILDGVEMGVLVSGIDTLEFEDYYYYNNLTLNPIGNFSATYSFEDEIVGTTNTDIVFVDSIIADSSCIANITSEFKYHNKVLELSDDNDAGEINAYNTAFDRQNGTIEFWWAQTDNNKESFAYLYDDGTGTAISLYMRSNGQYSWYDGSWHDVLPYSANSWYHHKITFNCSDGTKGRFSWYIDGELQAENEEFDDDCDSLDKLLFGTGTSSSGFDAYFDAIGFAWNWTYWEGENYAEQLPLVADIGFYPGTYNYRDDEIGATGTAISFIDRYETDGSLAYAKIVDEFHDHKKVLKLYDGSTSGNYNFYAYHDEPTPVPYGTIEFWVASTAYSGDQTGSSWGFGNNAGGDATAYCFAFGMDGDNSGLVGFMANGQSYTWSGLYADNMWFHVRIDFESTSGGYLGLGDGELNFWFDGVKKLDAVNMYTDQAFEQVVFISHGWDNTRHDYMDAMGFSWDTNYEIGDNLNLVTVELSTPDKYYLEIPHIGKVSDGQLDLEVKSNGLTEGSGKVFVKLIKEEMNLTKSDLLLLEYCEEFDSSQQFTYQKSMDLSPYVTNGQVYGTYYLQVQAFSTASTDVFNLTKFEIETDTYVAAEFGDTEAWVTNPTEDDTDGDNLSDYYEIFTGGTNPISVDTDGDDAWDDDDRDPLKDVMIEFAPISGKIYDSQYTHLRDPLLQIVINCSFVSPDYSIITPCVLATGESAGGYNREAYFSDYRYYANIDDDADENGEVIIPLQLWLIERHLGQSDLVLIGDNWYPLDMEDMWFDLSDPNTQELYFYASAGGGEWVYVECTLVGIEKANTIAIYDVNSTFTGRYHDREQGYSVIQLQIPDDGHYWGSESFLEEQIGANSTNIAFVDEDDSDLESMVKIIGEIDDHTNVLCLQEGLADHADITHDFSSQTYGTIEWWWRTSDINGGNSYFYLKNGDTDVIRLFMRDGKIKYHDGSYHDIMSASSNTWYRMKLVFATKIGVEEIYRFDLYVNGVLKQSEGTFYSDQNYINNLRIMTTGDPFNSYFDAFGYSWDSSYDIGDNSQTYSVEGTPFEHGMNVIVIPTEMFTHTLLNGYVENDDLDQTPLYHPSKNMFHFSGIERDGQPTQANADADLMFYRRSISPSDAQNVLDLILKGLLNETWDEEDAIFLHSYISTKLNDTKATVMNLPYSVLGFIPWFNSYSNSMMGCVPGGGENIWLWLDCLFNPILAETLHSQMAMSGGEFFKYLKGYVSNILMSVMTLLGDLIWLIARAAMLVLIYILLGIELLYISVSMLALSVPLLAISLFTDFDIQFDLNFAISYSQDFTVSSLLFTSSEQSFGLVKSIIWSYWEFFDLYIPWVVETTLSGDDVIYANKQDIFGNEENIPSDQLSIVSSEISIQPKLFNNSFVNNTSTLDSFTFKVKYFDDNFDDPDSSYGVRLHLIAPNGTALEPFLMNPEDENPDYSNPGGVTYNYTIDLSQFTKGLWHYYLTTMDDSNNDNLTVNPGKGYFTGPETVNTSSCLRYSRVTTSDYYNEEEGWADEDFNFYVTYWDIINNIEPESVYLCLIPANKSLGSGINNTVGIQKFEMITSGSNYSNPIVYSYSLKFTDLNYEEFHLGQFSHYYEANINETLMSFKLDCEGPFVKPVSFSSMKLDCYYDASYEANNEIHLASDSSIQLKVSYSSSSSTALKSSPTVEFINQETGEKIEHDMSLYSVSSDNTESVYKLNIRGEDIGSGSWKLNISAVNQNDEKPLVFYGYGVDVYTTFSIILDIYEGMNTFDNSLTFFGLLPFTAHVGSLFLLILGSRNADSRMTLIGNMLALGTTATGLTAASIAYGLLAEDSEENKAQLIGFAIACMMISVLYTLSLTVFKAKEDSVKNNLETSKSLLAFGQNFFLYISTLLGIFSMGALLLGFLSGNQGLDIASAFLYTGSSIVRTSFAVIALSVLLGVAISAVDIFCLTGTLDPIQLKYLKMSMSVYVAGMFLLGLLALFSI